MHSYNCCVVQVHNEQKEHCVLRVSPPNSRKFLTFDMVAEFRIQTIAERDETITEDNILDKENEDELSNTVRLHVHMTDDNTIAMMGKMNIKLPTPTQFDGKNPQFNEWAGEVKAYLTIHNVHFDDYMDECTRSVETLNITIIQDDYTPDDAAEGTDEHEKYTEMTANIRKKKDDILNFSQTLNYVLVHSTKTGSEAHSIVRRIMRQSSAFEARSWDSSTKQFTRQYYKWLEDIDRYESENGQGSITDHVHQWISNFFNSTYSGAEDEHGTIGGVNDETEQYNEQIMMAFNKWYKGKGKGQWNEGKGKHKGGKQGDNYNNAKGAGKDKGKQTVICYTCGRPRHSSPQCYQNTKGMGNKGQSYQYYIKGQQHQHHQQQHYGGGNPEEAEKPWNNHNNYYNPKGGKKG
eukprot:2384759-Amphidinium_carterae.2